MSESVANQTLASAGSTGYARWFKRLKTLAKKNGVEDWIDGDDDLWHEMFDDDYSPNEALNEYYMEMRRGAGQLSATRVA